MDFSFSDEQKIVATSLREFARSELLPRYAHWDRSGSPLPPEM